MKDGLSSHSTLTSMRQSGAAGRESLQYVNEDNIIFNIAGGNHAQFGWYGPQKGDGTAGIDTVTQQNIVVSYIIGFIA